MTALQMAAEPAIARTASQRVACPLCLAKEHDVRYALTHGAIVRCRRCAFHYVSPRLHADELNAKLQAWAQADVLDAERLRIAFDAQTMALYDAYLQRIEAITGGPGRILDVGCSTGAFLAAARRRGWQAEGLELGAASAAYAREMLGLDVHRASLFSHEVQASSYDAIVFLEVVEHLTEPAVALQRLARWLRPGGALLVSTPNYDSLYRRLFGTRWWVVNCEDEHIMFFDAEHLDSALTAAGLTVRWRRIRGFDLAGLARETVRSLRGAAGRRPDRTDVRGPTASPTPLTPASDGDTGYHLARLRKERIKSALASVGALRLVRWLLRVLDTASTVRWSPMHAWGEQLVMVAVKRTV